MSAETSLPRAVGSYFAADQERDVDAMVAAFTEDANVTDDGRTMRGREAIHEWLSESFAKYQARTTVLTAEVDGSRADVMTEVEGNFPGSPVNLVYRFELDQGLIDTLKVEVA